MPQISVAASFSFVSNQQVTYVGDTIVVRAILDTEGETINAIDGTMLFSGLEFASIKEISLANSQFPLWPNTPSVSPADGVITFVGGIPNGIKGKNIELFKIIIDSKKEGTVSLSNIRTLVFLNDGKGSAKDIAGIDFRLPVMSNAGHEIFNEWSTVVGKDTNAPTEFLLVLSRDPSVYDNRYFITFGSSDADSGIDYYEVTEGDLPPVRSSSPYVLQNQDPKSRIKVTAYDLAGNVQVAELNGPKLGNTATLVVIILILILARYAWYIRKRNYQNNE